MIAVGWLAPTDCWDQNIVRRLTSNELYPTGLVFRHFDGFPQPHSVDGCVLSVPGAYWSPDVISEACSKYRWVLGFRVSDECDLFDPSLVEHPNILWWVQTPREGREYPDGSRFFGVGYPPHFNTITKVAKDPPAIDVFLSAQRTHIRREQAFDALKHTTNAVVEATAGFTQGMPPDQYVTCMSRSKIAPAPSGVISPDSFRLWEALESHCVPIADSVSPADGVTRYWKRLFHAPFPVITDYADLPGWIDDQLAAWPANANRVAAWWARQKRRYAHWLRDDLETLGALTH